MLDSVTAPADTAVWGGTGRYPYHRGSHLIVALELHVYGDESGTHGESAYCVVAGYIAAPRPWDAFNAAWRAVVDAAGDKEFHAKYFFKRYYARIHAGRTNPYGGWDEGKCRRYLSDLLGVIAAHRTRVIPIGCAVDVAAFKALTWGERNLLTGATWDATRKDFVEGGAPSSVYRVALLNMAGEALERAKPKDCKVHFVMDEKSDERNMALELFPRIRASSSMLDVSLRPKLGDLTFAASETYPGIQAADLLAYVYNILARDGRMTNELQDTGVNLFRKRRKSVDILTEEALIKLIAMRLTYPEDRELIRAIPSPAERQQAKSLRRLAGRSNRSSGVASV
jgi:hypothetical protein